MCVSVSKPTALTLRILYGIIYTKNLECGESPNSYKVDVPLLECVTFARSAKPVSLESGCTCVGF